LPKSTPKALRNRLNKYAFALACVVAVVLGVVPVLVDRTLTTGQALSAVGLNLISAIVFAVIFSLLSTQTQERNLLETLDDQFELQDQRINEHIHKTAMRFLPSKTYPAASIYGDEFNQDVTESLRGSRLCAFRGTSAKFLAARVRRMPRPPHQLRIIMLDPSDDATVRRRAVDRRRQAPSQGKQLDDLVAEIKDEVCMSLVSLFDLRHSCPVEILLTREPVITRMELFDDSAYISWYQGPSSPHHPFPETYRFSTESFIYQTELLGIVKSFEISSSISRFDSSQSDDTLQASLAQLLNSQIGPAHIDQRRSEYEEFISPFDKMLDRLYAQGGKGT